MDTFSYLFNADEGQGSLAMFRAYMHAFDLGASQDEVEELLNNVNYNFWDTPMDEDRFTKTVLVPLRRKFNGEN